MDVADEDVCASVGDKPDEWSSLTCRSATEISSCQEVLMLGYDVCFAQDFSFHVWNHPFENLALYSINYTPLQNKSALRM